MWSADCHGPPQTAITLGDSMTSDPPEPVSVTWGGHLRLIELDGWFLSYQWLWEARSRRGNIRQRGSVRSAFKCLGSVFLSQLSSNSSRFSPLFYLFLLSSSPSLSLSPFFSSSPSLFSSSPSLSLSFSFLFFLSHPPSLFMFILLYIIILFLAPFSFLASIPFSPPPVHARLPESAIIAILRSGPSYRFREPKCPVFFGRRRVLVDVLTADGRGLAADGWRRPCHRAGLFIVFLKLLLTLLFLCLFYFWWSLESAEWRPWDNTRLSRLNVNAVALLPTPRGPCCLCFVCEGARGLLVCVSGRGWLPFIGESWFFQTDLLRCKFTIVTGML